MTLSSRNSFYLSYSLPCSPSTPPTSESSSKRVPRFKTTSSRPGISRRSGSQPRSTTCGGWSGSTFQPSHDDLRRESSGYPQEVRGGEPGDYGIEGRHEIVG